MIMAAAKKGMGLALLLKGGGRPADEPDGDEVDMKGSAKTSALRSMFSAAKAGNWEAAASAFESAMDACSMGGEGETEEF